MLSHGDPDVDRGETLLAEVIEAHGGATRWAGAGTVSAQVQVRGLMPTWLFPARPPDDYFYTQTVDVQARRTVMDGFPEPHMTCTFTPREVTLQVGGNVVERRSNARAALTTGLRAVRHAARWDAIDTAYFIGYAMSNYLSHPYSLGGAGIRVRRGPDWRGNGEIWRRLRVRHPAGFDSHCRDETFFVDERGLIRRHEYIPDVFTAARVAGRALLGGVRAAHFTTRHREVDGLVFPTFRRVMLAPPGRPPIPGLTVICAQLSELGVARAAG